MDGGHDCRYIMVLRRRGLPPSLVNKAIVDYYIDNPNYKFGVSGQDQFIAANLQAFRTASA